MYMREVLRSAGRSSRSCEPVKMNYNLLGNSVPHLHTHVVPRYADDPKPDGRSRSPRSILRDLPDDELRRDVAALREAIG